MISAETSCWEVESQLFNGDFYLLLYLPLWLIRWARRAGTRDFYPDLAAPVGPVQNIFFPTIHYFTSFVPIAQEVGQTVVLRRLSLVCVSGYTNTV
jgi:hypothetical protein